MSLNHVALHAWNSYSLILRRKQMLMATLWHSPENGLAGKTRRLVLVWLLVICLVSNAALCLSLSPGPCAVQDGEGHSGRSEPPLYS